MEEGWGYRCSRQRKQRLKNALWMVAGTGKRREGRGGALLGPEVRQPECSSLTWGRPCKVGHSTWDAGKSLEFPLWFTAQLCLFVRIVKVIMPGNHLP